MRRGNGELSPLAQMRAGKRPLKTVTWPGDDSTKVGLRIPSDYIMQQSRLDAWAYVVIEKGIKTDGKKDSAMGKRLNALLDDDVFARVLSQSLVMPDQSGATDTLMAEDVQDLRENTTAKEREILMRELAEFSNEMDPDLNSVKGAQVAELLVGEVLKKAGQRAALTDLLKGTPSSIAQRC
ncbi:MAG: hypothetical protein JRG91_19205, partial [Deltaproteobacteria bacterium]|nr:hypothetical protein [Deltaproteobacteria bacterium]